MSEKHIPFLLKTSHYTDVIIVSCQHQKVF